MSHISNAFKKILKGGVKNERLYKGPDTEHESGHIGCTVGCQYCYARNNVKRWHMIDDFAKPEFFPGKLKMMEKKRPQNFLLTGMSDLAGWQDDWRNEVFAKIRENPQHQFLFLSKRPDLE